MEDKKANNSFQFGRGMPNRDLQINTTCCLIDILSSLLHENDVASYKAKLCRTKAINIRQIYEIVRNLMEQEVYSFKTMKFLRTNLNSILAIADYIFNKYTEVESICIGVCGTFGLEQQFTHYR